jgi:Bacterial Ig-like domain (group 3)/FG-GAP-like repeat
MICVGRSIVNSFFAPFFGILVVLVLLPSSANAQSCNPSVVFSTAILSTPAGCPSYLTYFNDWPQDTKSGNAAVAVGDFNKDGKLDAVIALTNGGTAGVGLAVMLGNGDGTFQTPTYLEPCCNPDLRGQNWVEVGDFNNDGNLDIAGGTNGGYVYILLGNGDGTFKPPFYTNVTGCCTGTAGGAVGDFNGDGKLDLVVTYNNPNPSVAYVFLGNGDGTLQSNPAVVSFPIGDSPHGVVVGDFNHDGKLDFATANNTTYNGTVSVVFGNGNGTFQAPTDYLTWTQNPYNPGSNPFSIVAADFNNDGYLDLATLDTGSSEISVLINNHDGTFGGPFFYGGWAGNSGDGANSQQIAAADVNHDGKTDLVVTASPLYGAGVAILFGNGDGTFQQPAVLYATDIQLSSVAVGDFNGDGVPDIVVSSNPLDTLTVLLNKGDGSFKGARDYEPFVISSTNIRGGFPNNFPQPVSVAFGDFNGDGKPDLAVSDNANIDVAIYLNNGDGTFKENANYRTDPTQYSYGPNNVAVADLNRDGKLDLVAGGSSGTSFSTMLGNGDGTFQPAVVYQQNLGGSTTLAVADVNGDGIPDVIFNATQTTFGGNPYALYVALGNGDGTFKAPVATSDICSSSGFGPVIYVAVADVNRDGKPDILASCSNNAGTYPSNIFLLLGNGDGTFGAETSVSAGTYPTVIAVGDFNGDGKPDLAVGNNYAGGPTVSMVLGNGDGTFQSPVAYSDVDSPFWTTWSADQLSGYGNPSPTPYPQAIAVADFNKDGHLDLLVVDVSGQIGGGSNGGYYNNGVQLFLGNGDGTFQAEQSYLACWHGESVVADDLTGGGASSAAVACPSDGVVTVLINQLGLGQSKTSTTTALQSSLNPSGFGQTVTLTATVTPGSGTGTPSGTVAFIDGNSTLGSGSLDSSGQASVSTSALALGTHSITAVYGGDTNFSGSTSLALSQVVSRGSTTTVLQSSANPSNFGQSVTFTATINWSGPGIPTGTVTFMDGSSTLGSGTVNTSGQATFSTSALAVGTHSITASYGGDSNFTGSSSSILSQVISKIPTATALQSSANPSSFGQFVTFTATINWSGSGTPTGTVTFMDGTTKLGTGAANSSAQATYTTPALAAGTHSITASYGGDANFAVSTSTGLSEVVNKASTSTSLIASANPSVVGQSLTFTAAVTSGAAGTPTGKVTFMDGSATLGAGSLNSSAQTTFTTSALAVGTHSITATYSGDTNFSLSTSAALSQNISDFSLTVAPSSRTVKAGGSTTYTLTLTPLSGFVGTVSLSCTGAPAATTCTESPSVTLNGTTAASSTATVRTTPGKKGTPSGTFTLKFTGTFGALQHSATAALDVR